MKKPIILVILTVFMATLFAQSPQSFNYQAIVRDYQGNILANQNIGVLVWVTEAGTGIGEYGETFSTATNQFGLLNIVVGTGTSIYGNFGDINWGSNTYILSISVDITGGTDYKYQGNTTFKSVPYAFYADSSGRDRDWKIAGDDLHSELSGNVGVGTDDPSRKLTVIGTIRSAWEDSETDYMDVNHGPNHAFIKWGGTGNLDFRYDGNTLMTLKQNGSIGMGSETWCPGSALLQLNSATKGFRPPRMNTTQISNVSDPKRGLMVYNRSNSDEHLYTFNQNTNQWHAVAYDNVTIQPCNGTMTDPRDNQTYNIVQIGGQCWMAENLNIGTRIDGSQEQSDNGIIEKYCYDDLESICDLKGGLYQWDEMMQYATGAPAQGICPDGWHIPKDEEWKELEGFVDSQYGYPDPEWDKTLWRGFDAGLNLKATSYWNNNGNGTDLFGFFSIPGGIRLMDGTFTTIYTHAYYWTATFGTNDPLSRLLNSSEDRVHRNPGNDVNGQSVRCIRD